MITATRFNLDSPSDDSFSSRCPSPQGSRMATILERVPFFGDDMSETSSLDGERSSVISTSCISSDITDELDDEFLSEYRKNNWYKYAAYGSIGVVGLTILIAGLFFGYTWVGLGIGGALILGSAYSVKCADEQIKKDLKTELTTPYIASAREKDEEEDYQLDWMPKTPAGTSLFSGKKYHPLIG